MICDKCKRDVDSTVRHKDRDIHLCARCEVIDSVDPQEYGDANENTRRT